MPFICTKCDKVLKSRQSLDYHIAHNACNESTHYCEYCKKGFTNESNMHRHVKTICQPKED